MPYDFDFWKQWEGQIVDSAYPLDRCAGGDDAGAFYETQFQGQPATIRVVPGTPATIGTQLASWTRALRLSHEAVVKLHARGETVVGDRRCAYAVMERADDSLAAVLEERPLTPEETMEMLLPVIGALRYLESNGLAHANLTPAGIFAFGDQVKVASDELVPAGESGSKSRSIGALLLKVLGVSQSSQLPAPFAEAARHCLTTDPGTRWSLARIEAHLRGEEPEPVEKRSGIGWKAPVAVVAAVAAIAVFWPSSGGSEPGRAPQAEESAPKATPPSAGNAKETKRVPVQKPAALGPPTSGSQTRVAANSSRTVAETRVTTMDGITQVMPDIPEKAQRTITGRVRINVRVQVDGSGRVTEASLAGPSGSKYFSDRALAAARAWRFPPGSSPQSWMLRFELMRERIQASVGKLTN